MPARKRHHTIDGHVRHLSGWKPPRPDARDAHYAMLEPAPSDLAAMPKKWLDYGEKLVAAIGVRDQGQIGDCTAQSQIEVRKQIAFKLDQPIPDDSVRFQYGVSRESEGTPISEDSGCTVRDAMKTAHQDGYCPEVLCPSTDETLFFTEEPTAEQRQAASLHKLGSYHAVPSLAALKSQLHACYAVSVGFQVPAGMMSAETAKTGIVHLPGHGEAPEGGHDAFFVGYDDTMLIDGYFGAFQVLNSWSKTWGFHGTFFLSYRMFTLGWIGEAFVGHTMARA